MERASITIESKLKATPRAIEIPKGRGLTGKIAARFGIGYAPEGWAEPGGVFPNHGDKS